MVNLWLRSYIIMYFKEIDKNGFVRIIIIER